MASNNMNLISKFTNLFQRKTQTAELVEKQKRVIIDIMRENLGRYRRELDEWQAARELRHDVRYPSTHLLQSMYEDAMADTHLTSATGNRKLRIQNKDIVFYDEKGLVDEYPTKTLQEEEWSFDFIGHGVDSIFFGYNIIHVKEARAGKILDYELIPREHIIPEKGWIVEHVTDTDRGFPFRKFPNQLLYSQYYDNIGILEKASPMTILKRHSWGSWDEFEQLFGIPIRVGYIPTGNKQMQQEVSHWLDEMGRSAAGVFPIGTQIEIIENSKTDAFRVFFEKVNAVDAQLSKLVNHQTMTMDNGSSRSQADVHLTTQSEVTAADTKKTILWLNNVVKPILLRIGYPITEGHRFGVRKVVKPSEKILIDGQLMSHGIKLNNDYLERTYGVEIDRTAAPAPTVKKKP